jgi:hypothetical protein
MPLSTIFEILLKVALNIKNQSIKKSTLSYLGPVVAMIVW